MKKERILFDLIKSLTKSEKRFVKIYASRYTASGKNNYVKLFDFIDKLKIYDEVKLQRKIKNSSFTGNLMGVKNYLYFLLLDCLDFYHQDSCIDRRTSKYINIARVLSEKRLDDQSHKIIKKAKKSSEEFNQFENVIALNALQKTTRFKRENITNEKIQAYYKENFSAVDKIKTKLEYNKVYDELSLKRIQMAVNTDPGEKKELKALYDNPYFSDPSRINSFDAHMYYLLSKIEYSRILTDTKNASIYTRKLISLFENNTSRIADNVSHYIYALRVFISARFYINREEAEAILKKINSIPSLIGEKAISYDTSVQLFQTYYLYLTHIILVFRDYENAIPYIQKFVSERKKFENYFIPSFRLCIQYNIACIFFGAGQYKQALKWCNEAMSHPPIPRDDLIYFVHLLQLLIHYELGNHIILPSLIRSAYRFSKKIKNHDRFTIIFFKNFRLLVRAESDKKFLFIKFKEEILPLINNKDEDENDIFENIDILGWIEKRIKNPTQVFLSENSESLFKKISLK